MSGTVGKQLIRLSELLKHKNPYKSKVAFYTGLVVNTICGPAIDMAAYSFAPQSLIAPFGGLDVVWNALSAPYLLHEKLTFRRGMGCFLICAGTAMAGAFGSHDDKTYTIDFLEETLVNVRVLIYFLCFFVWFLFNVCIIQKRKAKGNPIRGVSLGMTAGTIAGNMFCVKASVEIIQYSIDYETGEPWKHWIPYAVLLGAAFFAISNVKYMTQGLQEFEALFMVTVYEGSMIVSGCVSGSIVLLDIRDLEPWRICAYAFSIVVIVMGLTTVFSNEMQNRSSLAAGKASIDPESLKQIKSDISLLPALASNAMTNTPSGDRKMPGFASPAATPVGSEKSSIGLVGSQGSSPFFPGEKLPITSADVTAATVGKSEDRIEMDAEEQLEVPTASPEEAGEKTPLATPNKERI